MPVGLAPTYRQGCRARARQPDRIAFANSNFILDKVNFKSALKFLLTYILPGWAVTLIGSFNIDFHQIDGWATEIKHGANCTV